MRDGKYFTSPLLPTPISIGKEVETKSAVVIGDLERCGGLYVLGQPRTGKSNLLDSMALSDIQNGHGILFIDPHTDAINDLLARNRLTKRDRTEQVRPAQSRLDIFRNNDMIRDIVGQVASTIDFPNILSSQKIVLLRLPVNLTSDVKHLIGTMILSEVLYAAFERAMHAEKDRPYFGIYCDEFQEFATPDFAKLFTQTGKYRVMPVVAHQTRLGQFKPGDPNQGATLAAPNKVLFALSSHDAQELALEFASEPPEETRLEEQYVISQTPVWDLMRGHNNPEVRCAKARARKTDDGSPVHSFRTLLADLATLTRNTVRFGDNLPITVLSRPTPLQQRAFGLLGIALAP